MTKNATHKQLEVLEFIRQWIRRNGFAPTVREIAEHFGVVVHAAAQHLQALERKQLIKRVPGKGRSLVLLDEASDEAASGNLKFPVMGMIAAGVPLATEAIPDDFLELSPEWFGKGQCVAVRVKGDSMAGDMIGDGDMAIIHCQKEVGPRDIAAVRIAGAEVTLKRLRRSRDQIELLSSNPQFGARRVPAVQVEVLGKLVSIIRKF